MGLWDRIFRTKAESWHFAQISPDGPGYPGSVEIDPEAYYVNAFVTSMHIANVRVATKKFYGVVNSFISLPSRNGQIIEYGSVSTPSFLKDVDSENLDRVVSLNRRALGPVPYRGGDMAMEIGLFSIPSVDLLEPYLGLVEDISNLAGVATGATPLVAIMNSALRGLLGSSDAAQLEIGVAATFSPPRTGYFCTVGASREDPAMENLSLAQDGRLVRPDGKEVAEPYLVFQVSSSKRRDDWASIPDLKNSYEAIRAAAARGDLQDARSSLQLLRRIATLCPDLLSEDGLRLHSLVAGEVERAFPPTQTSAGTHEMADLADLPLFG